MRKSSKKNETLVRPNFRSTIQHVLLVLFIWLVGTSGSVMVSKQE